jgi:hypothetical protein
MPAEIRSWEKRSGGPAIGGMYWAVHRGAYPQPHRPLCQCDVRHLTSTI